VPPLAYTSPISTFLLLLLRIEGTLILGCLSPRVGPPADRCQRDSTNPHDYSIGKASCAAFQREPLLAPIECGKPSPTASLSPDSATH